MRPSALPNIHGRLRTRTRCSVQQSGGKRLRLHHAQSDDQWAAGDCQLPVITRFIENRAVVTGYPEAAGAATGLRIGDIIQRLDGVPVETLVERWAPYSPASHHPPPP